VLDRQQRVLLSLRGYDCCRHEAALLEILLQQETK
jgi:hypothetical protein